MRFFQASPELFNAMRAQVMAALEQPNIHALQPWPQDITTLALAPHEYTPPHYAALIEYALANGGVEITEAEYKNLQPEINTEP